MENKHVNILMWVLIGISIAFAFYYYNATSVSDRARQLFNPDDVYPIHDISNAPTDYLDKKIGLMGIIAKNDPNSLVEIKRYQIRGE